MRSEAAQLVSLPALSEGGALSYGRERASGLAALGAPAFACRPAHFPDVMTAAIGKRALPVPGRSPFHVHSDICPGTHSGRREIVT